MHIVATKPGQPSDLRIEHLPIAAAKRVIKQAGATPAWHGGAWLSSNA